MLIEHAALNHFSMAAIKGMGMSADTKVLQYSSFVYDVCIYEIFPTLASGGCICVPSEWERLNDLPGAIRRLEVNSALLTPSVLSTFAPEDTPGLRTLVAAGEALPSWIVSRWAPKVSLTNGYGPAETTVIATYYNYKPSESQANVIGYATSLNAWVTAPDDPTRLAGVGEVGELLLEGTQLARGYVRDEAKTASAFIPAPPWHPRTDDQECRLYRTGDLVTMSGTGCLTYLGRRSMEQVKISGRRVELGEIESQIRACTGVEVISDLVTFKSSNTPVLVAFIVVQSARPNEQAGPWIIESESERAQFRELAKEIPASLGARLPQHMLPHVYVPVRGIPRSLSGKADRKVLRSEYLAHDMRNFTDSTASNSESTSTTKSAIGSTLREVWTEVLGVGASGASTDDFFSNGGDSLKAILFTRKACDAGLRLVRFPISSTGSPIVLRNTDRIAGWTSKQSSRNGAFFTSSRQSSLCRPGTNRSQLTPYSPPHLL